MCFRIVLHHVHKILCQTYTNALRLSALRFMCVLEIGLQKCAPQRLDYGSQRYVSVGQQLEDRERRQKLRICFCTPGRLCASEQSF